MATQEKMITVEKAVLGELLAIIANCKVDHSYGRLIDPSRMKQICETYDIEIVRDYTDSPELYKYQ